MESLSAVLRAVVEQGDPAALEPLLAPEVLLDSNSERGRRRIEGRDEVLAHLSGPGPGEVVDWRAAEYPTGAAITFEWHGASGADRRRWYLRRDPSGEITAIRSYAARVAAGDGGPPEVSPAVLAATGPGSVREPLVHGGNSGAALERIRAGDGRSLIAKRVGPASDWLGRITGDAGRTALLWEAGAFERMPVALDHGIETVVPDGDGWWVVMRDLSDTFLGDERRLSRAESHEILEVAALMHAEFAGGPPQGTARLDLRIGMSALPVAAAEREQTDLLPKQIEAAWDAFCEAVPSDVADEIMVTVSGDPGLATALHAAAAPTLLHGDLRDDNLGLAPDGIVLLDWDLATAGPPSVEFAWYLCHDAWRIDASHDDIEADFRTAEGEIVGERDHELGMLSGLLQYGWIFGHSALIHPDPVETEWAHEELGWWVPRTRRALEAVGGMPRAGSG
ncbi:phosphotransferase [Thermoleophilia bacterium SCSIO 60948]|nr:phosphotransferase [Thermoleophilia bacterium SCSIO 60948]